MNKTEAIEAMKQGHKVRHYLFSDDEYIYMKEDHIYDENDYKMEHRDANGYHIDFWTDRTDDLWELDGWEIHKTSTDLLLQTSTYPYTCRHSFEPIYPIFENSKMFFPKRSHKRTNIRKRR